MLDEGDVWQRLKLLDQPGRIPLQTSSPDEVGHAGPPAETAPIKTIRPVLFWSSVGAVCTAVAAYVYLSWIVSGNAVPADPGHDPIPGGPRLAITVFQIACPIMALIAIVYVVRKSLRERQLCVEAAVSSGRRSPGGMTR